MQDVGLILSEDKDAAFPDASLNASFSETITDAAADAEAPSDSSHIDTNGDSPVSPDSFFTVSPGDAQGITGQTGGGEAVVLVDYSAQLDALITSNQRMEMQLEACISILMIFMVVGLLNYIYKFFKIFF